MFMGTLEYTKLLLGYIFKFYFYKFLDFYVYYYNLSMFSSSLNFILLAEIAESNKYINEVKVTGIDKCVVFR